MELSRRFSNLRFPEAVIRKAISAIRELPGKPSKEKFGSMTISSGVDSWRYDNIEDFFAEFPNAEWAYLSYSMPLLAEYWNCELVYSLDRSESLVSIQSDQRHQINLVMNVFQQHVDQATPIVVKEPSKPDEKPVNIFIGHGRSKAWEELRSHLQDKHSYKVEAFESGARAGHHIRDILEDLLSSSSLALLVLTGEDETADQHTRARQNVIHETGLFQGRLGFSRAIVLLEEGVEEFSNMAGIQHVTFPKGHIRGTYGEVLAIIKREFFR